MSCIEQGKQQGQMLSVFSSNRVCVCIPGERDICEDVKNDHPQTPPRQAKLLEASNSFSASGHSTVELAQHGNYIKKLKPIIIPLFEPLLRLKSADGSDLHHCWPFSHPLAVLPVPVPLFRCSAHYSCRHESSVCEGGLENPPFT